MRRGSSPERSGARRSAPARPGYGPTRRRGTLDTTGSAAAHRSRCAAQAASRTAARISSGRRCASSSAPVNEKSVITQAGSVMDGKIGVEVGSVCTRVLSPAGAVCSTVIRRPDDRYAEDGVPLTVPSEYRHSITPRPTSAGLPALAGLFPPSTESAYERPPDDIHNRARRRLATVAIRWPPVFCSPRVVAAVPVAAAATGEEPQTISFASVPPTPTSTLPGRRQGIREGPPRRQDQHPEAAVGVVRPPRSRPGSRAATPGCVPGGVRLRPDRRDRELRQGGAADPAERPGGQGRVAKGEDPSQFLYNDKVVGIPIATAVNGIVFNDELAKQTGRERHGLVHARRRGQPVRRGQGEEQGDLRPGRRDSRQHRHRGDGVRSVHRVRPDADWDAQRKAGKVTFAGTPGWTTALESLNRLDKSAASSPAPWAPASTRSPTAPAGQDLRLLRAQRRREEHHGRPPADT